MAIRSLFSAGAWAAERKGKIGAEQLVRGLLD
jgi:hypothetical protein